MIDLHNNKYDRKTLKEYIYAVKLLDIVKTQNIDVTFAVRYILNKKYQFNFEDKFINFDTILKYQTHISYAELYKTYIEYNTDDDSVDDFETVSNRK